MAFSTKDFWQMVSASNWPIIRKNVNSTAMDKQNVMDWLEENEFLTAEALSELSTIRSKTYCRLYKKLERMWLQENSPFGELSDDSFHYFLWDIIGRGKDVYYSVIKDPVKAVLYSNDIEEGFEYLVPFEPYFEILNSTEAKALILKYNNNWDIVRIEKDKFLLFDNEYSKFPIRCKSIKANTIRNRLKSGESLTDIWIKDTVDSAYKIATDLAAEFNISDCVLLYDLKNITNDTYTDVRELFHFGRLLVLCGLYPYPYAVESTLDFLKFEANLIGTFAKCESDLELEGEEKIYLRKVA